MASTADAQTGGFMGIARRTTIVLFAVASVFSSCAGNMAHVRSAVPADWNTANANAVATGQSFTASLIRLVDQTYSKLEKGTTAPQMERSPADLPLRWSLVSNAFRDQCGSNAPKSELERCYALSKEVDLLTKLLSVQGVLKNYIELGVPQINAALNPQFAGRDENSTAGGYAQYQQAGRSLYFITSAILLDASRASLQDRQQVQTLAVGCAVSLALASQSQRAKTNQEDLPTAAGIMRAIESKWELVSAGAASELPSILDLSSKLQKVSRTTADSPN